MNQILLLVIMLLHAVSNLWGDPLWSILQHNCFAIIITKSLSKVRFNDRRKRTPISQSNIKPFHESQVGHFWCLKHSLSSRSHEKPWITFCNTLSLDPMHCLPEWFHQKVLLNIPALKDRLWACFLEGPASVPCSSKFHTLSEGIDIRFSNNTGPVLFFWHWNELISAQGSSSRFIFQSSSLPPSGHRTPRPWCAFDCPWGCKFQPNICGNPILLVVSLLWLGILQKSSVQL